MKNLEAEIEELAEIADIFLASIILWLIFRLPGWCCSAEYKQEQAAVLREAFAEWRKGE